MSSVWPDVVSEKIALRAEMGKIAREMKTRLAFAHYKAARGLENVPFERVEEERRVKRPTSSGDILSDSSSSTASELPYSSNNRQLMSSPLKGTAIFSDDIRSRSGSGGSTGHRKRHHHSSFDLPGSSSSSRKRFRSSPPPSRSLNPAQSWKGTHQFVQSSPIKPRKHTHFTNSSGPNLSFYRGASNMPDDLSTTNFTAASDDEESSLPAHSFDIRSSPPSTPPPRNRGSASRRSKEGNGKSGEEGADLLLYLATSPSPAHPTSRARMQPPSTPPPKNLALPSSMMTTPGAGSGLLSVFGGPNTPSQPFDFSDFVNITPSPAQKPWNKTPRSAKTPLTVARRRLTFDGVPSASPGTTSTPRHTGLGMQLGGDLLS